MIDFTKDTVTVSHPAITEQGFIDAYNAGETFFGFLGGVELTPTEADAGVPEGWPMSLTPVMVEEQYIYDYEVWDEDLNKMVPKSELRVKESPVLDENGEAVLRQKTFREYAGKACAVSLSGSRVFVPVGWKLPSGSRFDHLPHEELTLWAEHFGIERILTKSRYNSVRNLQCNPPTLLQLEPMTYDELKDYLREIELDGEFDLRKGYEALLMDVKTYFDLATTHQ